MDLRRSLRGEQQPEPELASLGGDLHELLGESALDRRLRVRRAQVVSLIDDDQDGSTLLTMRPEVLEHGEGGDFRLRGVFESAEIEHGRPRALFDHVDDRSCTARPQCPLQHLQVLHPVRQPHPCGVSRCAQPREHVPSVEGTGVSLLVQKGVVLLRIRDRVHLQNGRFRRRREIDVAHVQTLALTRAGAEDADVEFRHAVRIHHARRGTRLRQACEVAVRVEDEHRQLGVQQELLEHDTERIGLAAAALPDPEGVPVEASGIEIDRRVGVLERRSDGEVRHHSDRPFTVVIVLPGRGASSSEAGGRHHPRSRSCAPVRTCDAADSRRAAARPEADRFLALRP